MTLPKYKKGSVVVGYVDGGQWSASFGLSYRNLCLYDVINNQRIIRENGTELRKQCGTMGIADGRNEICQRFLDSTDGEWLWFVDTDMGFADDTVDRLVSSASPTSRPVMGALCFALKRGTTSEFYGMRYSVIPTIYNYAMIEGSKEEGFMPVLDYEKDKVQRAGATGCGCLLIHRSVLVKIREKSGYDNWFEPIRHDTANNGKPRWFSEDLSFCVRLAAVGVELHIDTSIKTNHEKGSQYLDEELYLERQEK